MSDIATGGAPAATPAPVTPDTAAPEAELESADGEADAAVAAEPAKPAPKKATPPPSNKKKYNLKVDGKEETVELDLDNPEEITKHLQMSRAAQKRMQQFSEYEKGVKGLFDTLKTDPLKVLADPRLGIPDEVRKKMAEAIINNEIEELQKTPEQREKERIQREYEALKKQHEDEKKTREQAEFQRMQEQAAAQYDRDISDAIASAGLPKTARTVKYMAEAMMFCLQNGLDLNAKDLVPHIKKQTLGDFREIISSLPDEEFEDWLGKDQIGRIRKRNLQRIKQVAQDPKQVKPTGAEAAKKKESEKPDQKISYKDFFKNLGK